MKLTNLQIKSLSYNGNDKKIFDGQGLYIHITKSGKYWRYKYRFANREKKLSIGVYPDVSLKVAREVHQEARALLRKGICPCAEKAKHKQTMQITQLMTFKCMAQEWCEYKRPVWSKSYAEKINRYFDKDIYPHIENYSVDDIEPIHIMNILNRIKHTPSTCKKVKQLIISVLNYAVQTGRLKYNPAQSLPNPSVVKAIKHYTALSKNDITEFCQILKKYHNRKAILGMRLLMLTFVRTNEIRNAQWSEINGNEWCIPAEKMKMRKPHIVPLSDWALETLDELKAMSNGSSYVLPGKTSQQTLDKKFFRNVIKQLGYQHRATPHGFRSMASSILNESGLFAPFKYLK